MKVTAAVRDNASVRTGYKVFAGAGVELRQDWRAVVDGWPEDLRFNWEETAAILEYDQGMPRAEAEAFAFDHIRRNYQDVETILRGNAA